MSKILHRYLLRENLYYLGLILVSGISIYLLIDFLDRADDFLSAEVGVVVILKYYVYKTPLIISQILPAVFLLAVVLQLGIMIRNRELLALNSNSITTKTIAGFFVFYAFFWAGGQLFFSQYFGTAGMEKTETLWKEEVRSKDLSQRTLHDLWFREGDMFVYLDRVTPGKKQGRGIEIYEVKSDRSLTRILRAKNFSVSKSGWELKEVSIISPQKFSGTTAKTKTVNLETDVRDFLRVSSEIPPESLSLYQLGGLIDKLSKSGSNVERLRTLWHSKLSYAASLVVMALIGVALVTLAGNIYLLVVLSLVLVFVYYAGFVIGTGLGETGVLHPLAAAWASDFVLALAAAVVVWWKAD
ncbi:MAG: LptF/LptG family permease [Desulfonatronovibrionaceae bacterium]